MSPPSPLNRRPRILQVVSYLTLGGAERVALTITRALRDEFDFSVHAVRGIQRKTMGAPLAQEVHAMGIPLSLGANVPMRFGGMLTSGIDLIRVVRRVRPDIIHLHTEIPEAAYATMAFLMPKIHAVPVVRTIQSTVIWDFCRPVARWCDRRMERAQVVGVSPGCLDAFQRLRLESRAKPPSTPPIVIYNGSDPTSSSAQECLRTAPDEPVKIVFGGRFEEQKGTDLLPEILRRVQPPKQGAHLAIYGCGTHAPLLRELASRPPNGWTLELHEPVPNFAHQLSRFDLVIMPSRYEGLALVAIEAAMAGTPVVGTDIAGLREIFPMQYPWLAQAGDAASFAVTLQSAVNDSSRWREVARQTQTYAREKFSAEVMADSYRKVYRRMLVRA